MSVYQFMDRGFPVIAAMGEYEREEFHSVLERTLAALSDRPAPGLLIDLSRSIAVKRRTNAEVFSFGTMMLSHRARFESRLAIVAAPDVTFGLMRMGLARADEHGLDAQVFREYERALAWLEAAAPPLLEVDRSA
jgi:hypothetical protein